MIAGLKAYVEMKDSGVSWLGMLPAHWKMTRAKWLFHKMDRLPRDEDEVVTCFRDGVVTQRKNRRVRGFTESLKEIGYQGIREGDLVIHAMDAFAGAVGVADSDGKGTPVYSVCLPVDDANAHFYAFLVREMARSQWIAALAKGIRERSTDFRFQAFGNQEVPVPPKEEQGAIVRFLDHADRRIRRAIAAKQKLIRLLEEQKQATVHRAVTRGLDASVRLNPSGIEWLGDVPENWETRRVSSCLLSSKAGIWGNDPTKANQPDHIICVRVADFDMDRLCVDDMKLTMRAVPIAAREPRLLVAGDILMEKSGGGEAEPVGRVVRFGLSESSICSNFITRLRPDRLVVNPEFLLQVLASMQSTRRNIPWIKQTTGIQNLSERGYLSLQIAVPPLAEQASIVAELAHLVGSIRRTSERVGLEIKLLREYRTRLIADVVTGKLDVREAAARLPDEVEAAGSDLDEGLTEGGDDIDGEGEEVDSEDIAA